MNCGKLLLVATPIGNLKDITLRALEVLKQVDVIAAEDTRHTIKLLNHYEIKSKLISFHEYSKETRFSEILEYLHEGKDVAIVSDAGTPVISDPGYALVARCAEEGVCVECIPGACAAISAVAVSGINCTHFMFWGFLSTKQSARRKELAQIMKQNMPCVIYESPNRVKKTLKDICEVCGEDTFVCVCRELTKLHEETLRMKVTEVLKEFENREAIKGEFVILIDPPASEKVELTDREILDSLLNLLKQGMTKKSAAEAVALEYDLPKNKVYKIALHAEKEDK